MDLRGGRKTATFALEMEIVAHSAGGFMAHAWHTEGKSLMRGPPYGAPIVPKIYLKGKIKFESKSKPF